MPRRIYKDSAGKILQVGDRVRVIGVPDLSGMSEEGQKESVPVFQYLVGKYKRVEKFNDHGLAWLSFRILRGENSGLHSVAIEPNLLKLHKPRKGNS